MIHRDGLRAAVAVATMVIASPFAHAQDAAAGKGVFAQCTACHSTDGSNGVGPSLQGVVGRKAGTLPGYAYSPSMQNSGVTWDEATLDTFIANPDQVVGGNKMKPFTGISDEAQRKDIIAFLKSIGRT